MYEVSTQQGFAAAHRLLNYNGPCENLHGHNWVVRVSVGASELDGSGIAMDFRMLKEALREVLSELDHTCLNDTFETLDLSPSSENIARFVYDRLKPKIVNKSCRLLKVEVSEAPGDTASYYEDPHA